MPEPAVQLIMQHRGPSPVVTRGFLFDRGWMCVRTLRAFD
jgi:hypothetical protein